ncbi:DUF1223 domain-containing protein [Rhizobium leguminosarum]|uniref:DUF1223 domain-containing protein n=1 Tax=Rhizobium leguminosarum TaxID=384 RepID=UPI001C93BCBF|nr:DUF1223 domain-containing protein [Rhizobium leguminosarum]MBY5346444.1 DUF1223 domain-containing protein [Rhizobium leguminosarum]
MNQRGKIAVTIASALAAVTTTMPVFAADRSPTVVELFTSQGCSSCPPANANLIKISSRPDVLALSFSVTYWDYLGWKDTYGKPEYTQRQVDYEPALRQAGPFTPQMVVNGTTTIVGNRLSDVEALLSQARQAKGPSLALDHDRIEIGGTSNVANAADVWLVRYDPRIESVPVARGENEGNTLPHTHVVHRLDRLGIWNGSKASFPLPLSESGLKTAILVQAPNGGPILSAITD